MTDTQWPRFMVFQKMEKNENFVHNGTVHAPDIEMALQYGRDIFVRRPEAYGMWVIPADAIYAKTLEEVQAEQITGVDQLEPTDDLTRTYHVFGKFSHNAQFEQCGKVYADSPHMALQAAIKKYADRDPLLWWVFPANVVLASQDEDIPSMFEPVKEHDFKNQAFYPVITMMREIRSKGKLESNHER